MLVTMNKKYRTENGREVRIHALDGVLPFPAIGAIKFENGWRVSMWTSEGKWHGDNVPSNNDLVETKPLQMFETTIVVIIEAESQTDAREIMRNIDPGAIRGLIKYELGPTNKV